MSKKLLIINEECGTGSTGKICEGIAKEYEAKGHEVKIAFGRKPNVPNTCQKYAVQIGSMKDVYLHAIKSFLLDQHGFGSVHCTKQFLKWADEYQPDILWLHNIHGYYINIELLFNWIKKHPNLKVKWTLHDCWAFTGHCTHFIMAGCEKWKIQCEKCPQKKAYPASMVLDNSRNNYTKKRVLFKGVNQMQLITPSQWLADLTRESFLCEYPVEVRYNTINRELFKPTNSGFKEKYGIQDKKMIVCVAGRWSQRKGFDDVLQLAKLIDNCTIIVIVGVSKEQKQKLPANVIGITRTENPMELAGIYTAADILFNPTHEDNYPTVNLEAEACGTRVITYDVGGAKETLHAPESIAIPVGAFADVCKLI